MYVIQTKINNKIFYYSFLSFSADKFYPFRTKTEAKEVAKKMSKELKIKLEIKKYELR